nr:hypothetical protein [Tanacetum cinerariifolium]
MHLGCFITSNAPLSVVASREVEVIMGDGSCGVGGCGCGASAGDDDGVDVGEVVAWLLIVVATGTEYQLANMFTKALSQDRFKYLVRLLSMRCLTPANLKVLSA